MFSPFIMYVDGYSYISVHSHMNNVIVQLFHRLFIKVFNYDILVRDKGYLPTNKVFWDR